jgi:hypothetical protein
MESAASGGFATGILRITALYFLGMRRLDFESPQQRLQAKRERRRGLQVPSGVIEASANIVGGHGERMRCLLPVIRV